MSDIRPLLLNARDTGGAANASRRIHDGLRELGVDSRMLVRKRSKDDPSILGPRGKVAEGLAHIRSFADSLPLQLYGGADEFSLDVIPDRIPSRVADLDPDVVQLNWVAGGFMSVSSIADFDVPLVWRCPDMWPFTGGCHYSNGCTGYRDACGCCPQLGSSHSIDVSRFTMRRKSRAIGSVPLTIVTPSTWLASCAEQSALFGDTRIEVIPNGLDTSKFRPVDPSVGRDIFDLPHDASLILFGSVGPLSNPRKGYDLLQEAINQYSASGRQHAELVVFGAAKPEDPPDFDLPVHYTGFLNDEQSLALLYSAGDLMVVPSRYEGFGQTVTEAMACGTPVAAFNATGPSDTVDHRKTGYLANPYEPCDLAKGIEWILHDEERAAHLGDQARAKAVKEYNLTTVSNEYLDLYRDLV